MTRAAYQKQQLTTHQYFCHPQQITEKCLSNLQHLQKYCRVASFYCYYYREHLLWVEGPSFHQKGFTLNKSFSFVSLEHEMKVW